MKPLFYTTMAKYYDKIYHYIDYEKHARFFIEQIKQNNHSENDAMLDIACGTGMYTTLFHKAGIPVTGMDLSKDMLAEAKRKYPTLSFIEGNMQTFQLNETFGIITILFNSILYNNTKAKLKQAMKNIYNHLDEKGIFMFDAVNKSIGINSKQELYTYKDSELTILFKPQWIYDKEKNTMDLDIEFEVNGEVMHDHQTMAAVSFEELKALAEEVGFTVEVLHPNYIDYKLPYTKETVAIFVCMKNLKKEGDKNMSELSEKTSKEIEEAQEDIKKDRVYTSKQIKKELQF